METAAKLAGAGVLLYALIEVLVVVVFGVLIYKLARKDGLW